MICIKNHIILAGLLNRTLLVHPSSLPSYDPRLVLDTGHLRRCFGARAALNTEDLTSSAGVMTSAAGVMSSSGVTSSDAGGQSEQGAGAQEADREGFDSSGRTEGSEGGMESGKRGMEGSERGGGVGPEAWVCWSTIVKLDRRTWRVRGTKCTNKFCRLEFQKVGIPEPATKADVCLKDLGSIVRGFATNWGDVRTLIIGDLTMMGFLFPPEIRQFGDAPFLRSSECPNALTVSPHPLFFTLASDFVSQNFHSTPSNSDSGFVGVHFRRGDFLGERCAKGVPSACLTPQEAASFISSQMAAAGIANVVICTDARGDEVRPKGRV